MDLMNFFIVIETVCNVAVLSKPSEKITIL